MAWLAHSSRKLELVIQIHPAALNLPKSTFPVGHHGSEKFRCIPPQHDSGNTSEEPLCTSRLSFPSYPCALLSRLCTEFRFSVCIWRRKIKPQNLPHFSLQWCIFAAKEYTFLLPFLNGPGDFPIPRRFLGLFWSVYWLPHTGFQQHGNFILNLKALSIFFFMLNVLLALKDPAIRAFPRRMGGFA